MSFSDVCLHFSSNWSVPGPHLCSHHECDNASTAIVTVFKPPASFSVYFSRLLLRNSPFDATSIFLASAQVTLLFWSHIYKPSPDAVSIAVSPDTLCIKIVLFHAPEKRLKISFSPFWLPAASYRQSIFPENVLVPARNCHGEFVITAIGLLTAHRSFLYDLWISALLNFISQFYHHRALHLTTKGSKILLPP